MPWDMDKALEEGAIIVKLADATLEANPTPPPGLFQYMLFVDCPALPDIWSAEGLAEASAVWHVLKEEMAQGPLRELLPHGASPVTLWLVRRNVEDDMLFYGIDGIRWERGERPSFCHAVGIRKGDDKDGYVMPAKSPDPQLYLAIRVGLFEVLSKLCPWSVSCDLCGGGEPRYIHEAADTSWSVCIVCHDLILGDRWDELRHRLETSWDPGDGHLARLHRNAVEHALGSLRTRKAWRLRFPAKGHG